MTTVKRICGMNRNAWMVAILAQAVALLVLPMSAQTAEVGIISTVAGNGTAAYGGDTGPGVDAALNQASDTTVDGSGNCYIADKGNHRVRKLSPAGTITTYAGNGLIGMTGDGGAAVDARLSSPEGVAVDGSGNLYIGDTENGRVRKVTTFGGISTYAGGYLGTGFSGDGGPAVNAKLSYPRGLALDGSGNLFIADTANSRIRKVSAAGIISTFAGNGEFSHAGDGGSATSAALNSPWDVALGPDGCVYIADTYNHRVRKVDGSGIITTVAGSGVQGGAGDGGPAVAASLSYPKGVALDADGALHIADAGNNRIRKVDGDGVITTIAGSGTYGYGGDEGLAVEGAMRHPTGIAFDGLGRLVIADAYNHRVRRVRWEEVNLPPHTPTNNFPADGATGVSLGATLMGSTFSDPNVGDGQSAARWQVRTSDGSYDAPLFDSGTDTTHKTQITLPEGVLSPDTIYYWRVGHRDVGGEWSAFSSETSFTASGVGWRWHNPLPQGNPLNHVWGSSETDAFAVGPAGTILHYDGTAWSTMVSGTSRNLNGVWGSSGSDVFAVGDMGVILHYDGNGWSAMTSGTTGYLYGVWGTSATNVFAVGTSGTVLRYNGSSWNATDLGVYDVMTSVWGSSGADVYAVGYRTGDYKASMFQFDGTSWSTVTIPEAGMLKGVWGSSDSDVFAVGESGTVLHFDGSSWTLMTEGVVNWDGYNSVWGTSSSNVYAVGRNHTVLRYDGSSWSQLDTGYSGSPSLFGVWAGGSTVFTVGNAGMILRHDGSDWTAMSSAVTTRWLFDVWGTSGSDLFAVGQYTPVLHYDGTAWSLTTSTSADKRGIWGASGTDVFAVGPAGVIEHYDGTAWSTMTSTTALSLLSVWGSSGSDVFAVGQSGTILHYDGSVWSAMQSGATVWLRDVWGSSGSDVFAVGDGGTILHYDGAVWNAMTSGSTQRLYGVWGSSGTDVWAVGNSGTVLHYDGSAWSTVTPKPISQTLHDVWGRAADDVFVVGYYGDILHYDGSGWETFPKMNTNRLEGVWCSTAGSAYAVGNSGTILHYTGEPPATFTFTVARAGNGNGAFTPVEGSHTYDRATVVTVTAEPAADSTFAGWSGDAQGTSLSTDVIMYGDRTVTGSFAMKTLTITASGGEHGSVAPAGAVPVIYGQDQTFQFTPDPHYHVSEVRVDGNGIGAPSSHTFESVTADHTIAVDFSVDTFAITFQAGAHGAVQGAASQTIPYGGSCTQVTAVPDTGYHFTGWSGGASGLQNPLTVTGVTSDREIITARFAPNLHTITVESTPGGHTNPEGTFTEVAYGSSFTATAVPDPGYHFTGWSGSASGTNPELTVTVTGNMTLSANFAINTYTVEVTAGTGGATDKTGTHTVTHGESFTVSADASDGYHFTGWSGDASGTDNPISVTVTAEMTLSANFAVNEYTVEVAAGTGGVTNKTGSHTVTHGESFTVSADASDGYHFTGWSGDASGTDNPISVTVTANMTLTANFEINQYTVEVTAGPGGATNKTGAHTVTHGESFTVSADASDGYHFTGWSGDASGTDNPLSVTVTANMTLAANFEINQYTVEVAAGTGGATNKTGAHTVTHGESFTVSADASDGYHFTGWSGDASGTDNPLSVTVTADMTLAANFEINQYTVEVTAGTGGATNKTGFHTVTHGESFTVSADASDGYHFTGWSGDASGTDNPLSVIVTANMTLAANFAINQYTVEVTAGTGGATNKTGSHTVTHGESFTVSAHAIEGHHFTGWSGSLNATDNPLSVTVTANMTLSANFTINTYTVTATAGPHGVVSPAGAQAIHHGEDITFEITPDTGWTIHQLLVDGDSIEPVGTHRFSTVTQSHTIEASFTETVYPVTTVSVPAGAYPTTQTVALSCDDGPGSGCAGIFYTLDGTTPTEASPAYTLPLLVENDTTISYFSKDTLGNSEPVRIALYVIDRQPPAAPVVSGQSPSNAPRWTWTGAADGAGTFGIKLDDDDFSSGVLETNGTTYVPAHPLDEQAHTLYVRERDAAGNWSAPGWGTIVVDRTAPEAPTVTSVTPTRDATPTWTWTGGDGGNPIFRYGVDTVDLSGAGEVQTTSFTPEAPLSDGTRILYVEAGDAAGNWSPAGSFSVVIDTTAPERPAVSGSAAVTNDVTPTWTLASGGGDGSGVFRFLLDESDLTNAPESSVLTFTPAGDLGDGAHTLYGQERDTIGNWSDVGSFTIVVDTEPPAPPHFQVSSNPPFTNDTTPTWWVTGGGGGNNTFRGKIGSNDFSSGAGLFEGPGFTTAEALAEGTYRLYVQERDVAGNWSATAFYDRTVDLTPPGAPAVTGTALTNQLSLTWTWSSGGGGGGIYRYAVNSSNLSAATETYSTRCTKATHSPEGSYTLYVWERDAAGNWSASGSFLTVVDMSPPSNPVITSESPTRDATPTWTWTSGGDGYGLFKRSLDSGDFGTADETGELAYTPGEPLYDGNHTLYVWERDEIGNWSSGASLSVLVDTTAPVTSAEPPAGAYNSEQTVTLTCDDGTGSGCAGIHYTTDGELPTEASPQYENPIAVTADTTIMCLAMDLAGNTEPVKSIFYDYDTDPPGAPLVTAVSPTPSPSWTWTPGAGDGIGSFRVQVDDADMSSAPLEIEGTAYTHGESLTDGPHTLYVQERDAAGNWSQSGSFQLVVDTLPPDPPLVTAATPATTPTWNWTPGDGDGIGIFRVKPDDSELSAGATQIQGTAYTHAGTLVDGPHTLYVQERDAAGNWSTAGSFTLVLDATPPAPPEVSGLTPVNTPSPRWHWSGTETGAFRLGLDTADPAGMAETAALSFSHDQPLEEGPHTLYVQERDELGNWSAPGSWVIVVDLTAPLPPVVTGPPIPVNSPVWTWTGTEGGPYRCALDGSPIEVAPEIGETAYIPAEPLADGPHTLHVQERDAAGNWSPAGSYTVEIDATPPAPPLVAGVSPTRDQMPTWNWVSGGGGNGRFRTHFDDPSMAGALETDALAYTHPYRMLDGTYTLYVWERDAVGNWSPPGALAIQVDATAPVTVASPDAGIYNSPQTVTLTCDDGTGSGCVAVTYSTDGSEPSLPYESPLQITSNAVLRMFSVDAAGNREPVRIASYIIDTDPPASPLVSGETPTDNATPVWSWITGGGGAGVFRYALDTEASEGAPETTALSFTPADDLSDGVHTLAVQERDSAQNWSLPSLHRIEVDTRPLGPPTVYGQAESNDATPTWRWNSGVGIGTGTFRYKLGDDDLTHGAVVTTATAYSPATPLAEHSHTLYVQERAKNGHWTESGAFKIRVDLTPPPPPQVSGAFSTGDTTPAWNVSSGYSNVTTFRYKLNHSDLSAGATLVTADTFTFAYTPDEPLADGTHRLYVQSRDNAGNWSPLASNWITVDTTPARCYNPSPSDGATGRVYYGFNLSLVSVCFTTEMDATTITPETFLLFQNQTAIIPDRVEYVEKWWSTAQSRYVHTARFFLAGPIDSGTTYTAVITTGARDALGNAPAADYSWTFTTLKAPNSDMVTDPEAGATGAPVGGDITARVPDPFGLYRVDFNLNRGEVPIPGSHEVREVVISQSGGVTRSRYEAVFTPDSNLAYGTSYAATMNQVFMDRWGNPHDFPHTWTFTTAEIADTTPPRVTAVSPAPGSVGASTGVTLSATFDEPMKISTLTAEVFTVSGGVSGTFAYNGETHSILFDPSEPLAFSSAYTATVSTAVEDTAGNPLSQAYTWTFTTGENPDKTPPRVTSTNPPDGAAEIAINTVISVTFDEPLDPSSVGSDLIALGGGVPGTVTFDGNRTVEWTPAGPLEHETAYTVTVATGVRDPAGNVSTTPVTWSFTTCSAADTAPPTVVRGTPSGTNILVGTHVGVTFSEAPDPMSVNPDTFQVRSGAGRVAGSVVYHPENWTAVFTPDNTLNHSTVYTCTVTTGITDEAGNALESDYIWSFTTDAVPDTATPYVVSVSPIPQEWDALISSLLTVTFSEAMDAETLDETTIRVNDGNADLAGTLTYDPETRTASFAPDEPLAYDTDYNGIVSSTVCDTSGNPMGVDYTWNFSSEPIPEFQDLWGTSKNDVYAVSYGTVFHFDGARLTPVYTDTREWMLGVWGFGPDDVTVSGRDAILHWDGASWSMLPPPQPTSFSYRKIWGSAPDDLFFVSVYDSIIHYDGAGWTEMVPDTPWDGYFMDVWGIGANDVWAVGDDDTLVHYDGSQWSRVDPTNNVTSWFTSVWAGSGDDVYVSDAIPLMGVSRSVIRHFDGAEWNLMDTPDAGGTIHRIRGIPGSVLHAVAVGDNGTILYCDGEKWRIKRDSGTNSTLRAVWGNGQSGVFVAGDDNTFLHFELDEFDFSPPEVDAVTPVNGAGNVPYGVRITATFDKPMDPASISTDTFLVDGGITGTVSYDAASHTAVFTPSTLGDTPEAYTVTITAGVTDGSGNNLAQDYSWSFSTGDEPDTIKPLVIGGYPGTDATGVPVNVSVTAVFSEPMDPASVNTSTFTVQGVAGTVTYNAAANTAVFTPTVEFAPDTVYHAIVAGAWDVAGNFMGGNGTFPRTFTTGSTAETSPPVTAAVPPGGTYDQGVAVELTCMDEGSGCAGTYWCLGEGCVPDTRYQETPGEISINESTVLRFYSVDTGGNREQTRSEAYTIGSAVAGFEIEEILSPQYVGEPFVITVAAMDAEGYTLTEFSGTLRCEDLTGTLDPDSLELTDGTGSITVTVDAVEAQNTVTVTDEDSPPIEATSALFEVKEREPLRVTDVTPEDGDPLVFLDDAGALTVTVTFDQPLDPSTLVPDAVGGNFYVRDDAHVIYEGDITYDDPEKPTQIVWTSDEEGFARGVTLVLHIGAGDDGVKSLHDRPLREDFESTFTTFPKLTVTADAIQVTAGADWIMGKEAVIRVLASWPMEELSDVTQFKADLTVIYDLGTGVEKRIEKKGVSFFNRAKLPATADGKAFARRGNAVVLRGAADVPVINGPAGIHTVDATVTVLEAGTPAGVFASDPFAQTAFWVREKEPGLSFARGVFYAPLPIGGWQWGQQIPDVTTMAYNSDRVIRNLYPVDGLASTTQGIQPAVINVPMPSVPVLSEHLLLHNLDKFRLQMTPVPYAIVGVVPLNAISESGLSLGGTAYRSALVQLPGSLDGHIAAHEVGHIIAFPAGPAEHTPVPYTYAGYDIRKDRYLEWDPAPVDGMYYQGCLMDADADSFYEPYVWITRSTYNRYMDYFAKDRPFINPFSARLPAGGETRLSMPRAAADRSMVVSGQIVRAGGTVSARFDELIVVAGGPRVPDPAPGGFTVETIDAGGQILHSIPFAPQFVQAPDGSAHAVFLFQVPDDPTPEAVRLTEDGVAVAGMARSTHAPVVHVTAPAGGTVSGNITVEWDGIDPDGDALTYAVLFSHDNGISWVPVGMGVRASTLTVDSTTLTPGTDCLLKVIARDGFNSSEGLSEPFRIATPPAVASTVPAGEESDVKVEGKVRIHFTHAIDPSTLTSATCYAIGPTGIVPGNLTYEAPTRTALFSPLEPFAYGTTYGITLTTGIRDDQGLGLPGLYHWSFTTAQDPEVNTPPTVVVSGLPLEGDVPLTVTFTAQGSDVDGSVREYRWDFDGDGSFDEQTQSGTASHTYTQSGVFRPFVRVIDDMDGSASGRLEVVATDPAREPPSVELLADVSTGDAPLMVRFTATADVPHGTLVGYAWDFDGDRLIEHASDSTVSTHLFRDPGTYIARVSVVDDLGATAVDSTTIVVTGSPESPPQAGFDALVTGNHSGAEVRFTDLSEGTVTERLWDFGDGTHSMEANPVHLYHNVGTYTVRLIVTGPGGGDTEEKAGLITISIPAPAAWTPPACEMEPTLRGEVSAPVTFTLTNTSAETVFVSSCSFTGAHAANFTLSNDTCSNALLEPQDTCSVTAACAPLSGGLKQVLLSAQTSKPGALPATSTISALGIGRGDINGDGKVDLADIVTALRVATGMVTVDVPKWVDVDGDGCLGVAEVVYAIEKMAQTATTTP